MPKIKQSPKLPPEKRRAQLLTAARKLFVKKGFRGTTTDEIARRAKLTKGALYHHFESKEDILFAIVDSLGEHYQKAMEPLMSRRNISPTDILETLLNTHKSEDLAEFRNLLDIWVQAIRIPRIMETLEKKHLESADRLAECIDKSYGRTRKERRALAIFAFSFYDGVASRKCVNPRSVDVKMQLQLFSRCMKALKSTSTGT
ncbi:MAG: TetR/AcrR family transcriptional regulator [bacterium]|nr:TetR/AcrR family transcriptional regulator [bacterium]